MYRSHPRHETSLYSHLFHSLTLKASNSNSHSHVCGRYLEVYPNTSGVFIGGASNHVHIITHIHPTEAPAFLVKDIKLASHKMILKNGKSFSHFTKWQVGYSLFTYHISAKMNLIRYVENQREHHKIFSYKEELIALLKDNSVDYNEDFLLK